MKYKYTVYLPNNPRYVNAILVSEHKIVYEWSVELDDPDNNINYRPYIRNNTPRRQTNIIQTPTIKEHFYELCAFRTKQEFKKWHLNTYFMYLI
jgi:hypothetical protein